MLWLSVQFTLHEGEKRRGKKNVRDRQAITCTPAPGWPSSESKGKQYGCHRNTDEACTDPNRHTVHLISKATMSWHTCKVGDKALVCVALQPSSKAICPHTPALMRQLKVSLTPLQSGMPSATPKDGQMSRLQRAAGLAKVVTGEIPESMPCSRKKSESICWKFKSSCSVWHSHVNCDWKLDSKNKYFGLTTKNNETVYINLY